MQYAVLDIEATGGKAGTEKIIDIYIYKFNGTDVLDQFGSMVNPQRKIDDYVQKLTGITDKMVRGAPKFYELAKRVIEITQDCVIVGHGVNFDYRMLRQEFRELGYDFERKTLDTLDLSQKLIPNAESYSLGKLTRSLGIPVSSRHTAEGDTRITLELFKILLEKDKRKDVIQNYAIHETPNNEQVSKLIQLKENLPAKTGIYYFLNDKNKVIYSSGSRNIRQDVNKIFASNSKNDKRIQSQVEDVQYEITGSFLIALLKENEEHKIHKHILEASKNNFAFGLFADKDQNMLKVEKTLHHRKQPILLFHTKKKGIKTISKLKESLNIQEGDNFNTSIKKIRQAVDFKHKNFIIIDKGPHKKEKSFIEVRNKKVVGYGFYTFYNQLEDDEIREKITITLSNSNKNKTIIKTFLQSNQFRNIIPFEEGEQIKIPKK